MQTLTTSLTLPPSVITTPILVGYYYAIADNAQSENSKNSEYALMQISDIQHKGGKTLIKIQQFADSYKVLPEFINPAYLGTPIAQFWLEMGEFLAWQPLLLQRGAVVDLMV